MPTNTMSKVCVLLHPSTQKYSIAFSNLPTVDSILKSSHFHKKMIHHFHHLRVDRRWKHKKMFTVFSTENVFMWTEGKIHQWNWFESIVQNKASLLKQSTFKSSLLLPILAGYCKALLPLGKWEALFSF